MGAASGGLSGEGAGSGAFGGAAVGLGGPLAIRSVREVGGRVVAPAARKVARVTNRAVVAATGGKGFLDPKREVSRHLVQALEMDGLSTKDARAATGEWLKSGASSPALLDVAGENTRALLRTTASQPGPARQTAARYRDEVEANLQSRAIGHTHKLTPDDKRSPSQVVDTLRRDRGDVADRLYPEFQADLVPVGDDINSALSGDAGATALDRAWRIADARRDYDTLAELGALKAKEATHVSAGTLDLIRRGVRDSAAQAENAVAAGLKGRAAELDTALMDVPGFNTARRIYADYSRRMEGVKAGGTILDAPPDIYSEGLAKLSAEGLLDAGVGARQALVNKIGRPAKGDAEALDRIASSTNTGDNLAVVYGPDATAAYRQQLGHELQRFSNARFVSTPPQSTLGLGFTLSNNARKPMPLTDHERAALMDLGVGPAGAGLDTLNAPAAGLARHLQDLARRNPHLLGRAVPAFANAGVF